MKNNLKKYRKSMGFTQEQVGNMAGITKSFVSYIESGGREISLRKAYAISSAVGESIESVFPDPNDYHEHGDGFIRSVVKYGK